jgi:hypothetical protein
MTEDTENTAPASQGRPRGLGPGEIPDGVLIRCVNLDTRYPPDAWVDVGRILARPGDRHTGLILLGMQTHREAQVGLAPAAARKLAAALLAEADRQEQDQAQADNADRWPPA